MHERLCECWGREGESAGASKVHCNNNRTSLTTATLDSTITGKTCIIPRVLTRSLH